MSSESTEPMSEPTASTTPAGDVTPPPPQRESPQDATNLRRLVRPISILSAISAVLILLVVFACMGTGALAQRFTTHQPSAPPVAAGTPTAKTTPATKGTPATTGAVDPIVVAMLQNMRDNGYNPAVNGLYINWRYGSSPLLVNWNGSGAPDANPATRHDPLTDLRYLHNLLTYHSLVPADHQFDADISRYTAIVKAEQSPASDQRGWVYFELADMAKVSGDSFYANAATQELATFAHGNGNTGRGDWDIEQACALIVSGNPSYVTLGRSRLETAYAANYDAQNHIISSRGQIKLGETGQIIEALHFAGYDDRARDLLQGSNVMWDSAQGGYFAQAVDTNGVLSIQRDKKDPGRQAEMLRAAKLVGDAATIQRIQAIVIGPAYYSAGHGMLYEENDNWTPRSINHQSENWVTTEAMGIAIEALLA